MVLPPTRQLSALKFPCTNPTLIHPPTMPAMRTIAPSISADAAAIASPPPKCGAYASS
jgi:hypothetical protein